MQRQLPAVSVIDFARAIPLPDSRPGTVLSFDDRYPLKATVEVSLIGQRTFEVTFADTSSSQTIPDREAPHHRLPGGILKGPFSADRSPVPGRRKASSECAYSAFITALTIIVLMPAKFKLSLLLRADLDERGNRV